MLSVLPAFERERNATWPPRAGEENKRDSFGDRETLVLSALTA